MSSDELDLFVKALQAAGQSETDAKILSFLIIHGVSSAHDIIENCGLSKGTVYTSLQKLQDYGFVIETEKRPAKYQVSNQLVDNVKTEIEGLSRFIIKKVDEIKIPETREVLENIKKIFEANNFILERPQRTDVRMKDKLFHDSVYLTLPYDYVAHREVSIGIIFLDKNKIKKYGILEGEYGFYRMFDIIRHQNDEYQLITTFLFIHADPSQVPRIEKTLNRLNSAFTIEGPSKRPWRIFFTNQKDLEYQVSKSISDIRSQKLIVDQMVGEIKAKLNQIDEAVVMSKLFDLLISDFITGEYPDKRAEELSISKIVEPIQDIAAREMRNLSVSNRRYMEMAVRIYGYLDSIERKVFLPSMSYLENDVKQLNLLISKFEPIEYELEKLHSEMIHFVDSGKLNPFIFTEPYDLERNVVDQEKMKEIAEDFSNTIKKGLPNFIRFIIGEAGVGKTKILKHVFKDRLEEQGIGTVYVDCPVSFDLTKCICDELLQEDNFPPDMRNIIRVYRKQRPETTREILHLLEEITEIILKMKKNGFVLIIDELENTLPYISPSIDRTFPSQRPLALRQLSEILENRTSKNLGFLIGCREGVFSHVKENLGIVNAEKFVYNLEKLNSGNVNELIETRYRTWSIEDGPGFSKTSIDEIIRRTNGNTRNIIKYLRELYDYSQKEKKSAITEADIQRIGEIPLFRD